MARGTGRTPDTETSVRGAMARRSLAIPGLVVALAAAGSIFVAGDVGDRLDVESGTAAEGRLDRRDGDLAARPPALAGRGRAGDADGGAEAGSDGAIDGSGRLGPGAGNVAAVAPAAAGGATPFVAVAPGAVDDHVAPSAPPSLPLRRSHVVGRVGAYGVRDLGDVRPRTWRGVARVVGEEAAESSEDAVTTAVLGTVVADDGAPVWGAEVILYSSFYLRHAHYDHHVRQIGRAFSDAEGRFDVRAVALDTVHFGAGGEVLATVRHSRFADVVVQPLRGIVPGRESDVGHIVLPAHGVTIRGAVHDSGGRPVAGAVVRASGVLVPTDYDKTERMVVLDECPAATTDAEGRYVLTDFAAGEHEVSIHVNIDCVVHVRARWEGEREWSPVVRAGHAVRGRVVDPEGRPVEAAVVAGGSNWTPSNADGTFWLDNVDPGPLRLEAVHHAWHTVLVEAVPTDGADVTIAFARPLARITLEVVDGGKPLTVVAIDWSWPAGSGPGRFSPDSRYWHDADGTYAVVVPEGATGATVSDATGARATLAASDLADGTRRRVTLVADSVPR